jgi:hypothetical protein
VTFIGHDAAFARFRASLTGRITLLLMLGMASASIVSLVVAQHVQILRFGISSCSGWWKAPPTWPPISSAMPRDQALLDRRELYGVRNDMEGATLAPAERIWRAC